ncbi:hydroxylase [Nonomuraea sp. MG754425]|uniref:NmrA family NAD(P)-binding protein n=1 Tax=Nonomuraea sp. MG754425 TaxID=2570319 RepID=UPI001F2F8C28|nr:NAD(P)H-binding protein [Nonomuraea sp. MG754425]MCF6467852.1 hydroxylase [Nonomuraea sp. MG754425]
MSQVRPILVTGAAGSVGAVGRTVVETLRRRELPVRALVHREDARAEALRATGAEVVVADLTRAAEVVPAMRGVGRVFFTMSVSPSYLEAAVVMATVARESPGIEAFVNLSQLTVSGMSTTSTEESRQQRLHWLAEQALTWSGLPLVLVRPTVFLEHPFFTRFAAASIAVGDEIRLPFGAARTSPVAAGDVADVVATVLADPAAHLGKAYELTGPRSEDMNAVAAEYSEALGRPIRYVDVPMERWLKEDLNQARLPDHLAEHIATMARLHARGRYARLTHDVEKVTARPATSVRDFVAGHAALYAGRARSA